MVELEYLTKLLDILKSKGITTFKYGDLECTLNLLEASKDPEPTKVVQEQHVPILGRELPPDLRTDSFTSYDKMLHWSASPDAAGDDLPLTGDEPLSLETLAAP